MEKKNLSYRSKIIRGPTQVQVDITNKCNFRCLHCYNKSGDNLIISNELSDEEFIKLTKDIRYLQPFNICYCGGEPLLRRELLIESVAILHNVVSNISIVTTGFFLTEELLMRLINAGVNRIQISLDGNCKGTHQRLRLLKDSYEKAVAAIDLCLSMRSRLKSVMLSFIPTSFNVSEFYPFCERFLEKGIDVIRVQPLMPIGRAIRNAIEIIPTDYQYRYLIHEINKLQAVYGEQAIQWGDPVDHIIRFRSHLKYFYPHMAIKANGDLETSAYIPIIAGNVREHSIIEYWENGYPLFWNHPVVQEYAKEINSIADLGKKVEGYPLVWEEADMKIDILSYYKEVFTND